ncbi:ABC transporter family substrate-binding protein [Mariniluteicoccus endophyticus]
MKVRRIIATGVLVPMALVGCSKAEDRGESNTVPMPAQDVNAKDRGSMQPGGEMRLPVEKIGNLNPMSADASDAMDPIRSAYLPSFFTYDSTGVARPNPAYVVSAEETSQSPTKVALKLNQRAVWGDGTQITAKDLIATWSACNGRSQGFRCASDLKFTQIADVRQNGSEQDVEITFNTAYPSWRQVFDRVSVLRAESVKDAQTFNGWTDLKKGWTSGPFGVDKWDAANNVLIATPSAQWWGDKPMLDRIVVRQVAPENQIKAFTENETDVVEVGQSQEAYEAVKRVPDYTLRKAAATTWRQLVLNTASGSPTSDQSVRKAIMLGLNRSAIGAATSAAVEGKPAPLNNRILLPGQEGYSDSASNLVLTRDLDKARKTLDDAGWKESGGTRSKDGKPLKLTMVQVRGFAPSEAEAAAIRDQLKQIGVQVDVQDISPAQFDDGSVLSGGEFDLITMGGKGSTDPYADLADRFTSGAERNYARLESPEVDALVEKVKNEASQQGKADAANELDRKLWDLLPTIPLYQNAEVVGTRVRVANYGAMGLASVRWDQVGHIK